VFTRQLQSLNGQPRARNRCGQHRERDRTERASGASR
jgi:hypothetical protein